MRSARKRPKASFSRRHSSSWPATADPKIDGGDEFAGALVAAWTTAVAAELTGPAEPAVFVAETASAIVDPMSGVSSRYVEAVTPKIETHDPPELSQRSH